MLTFNNSEKAVFENIVGKTENAGNSEKLCDIGLGKLIQFMATEFAHLVLSCVVLLERLINRIYQ